MGRKISRTRTAGILPAEVEHYVYNGNQVAADLDGSGDIIRSYTWGPGVDNLLAMTLHPAITNTTDLTMSTPLTLYPLKDHQNSILGFTDVSGNVIESYEYDAWGNVTVYDSNGTELTSDLGLPTSAVGNRYMWQGREYDFTTGLTYFRARWYNPETGRWLSKDPIGISGGLNLYAFCGNNPVNFIDPYGLDFQYPPVGGNIHGNPPDAWAGDGPKGDKRSGGSSDKPPWDTDVDFIKNGDQWSKIRGPVWVGEDGKIRGWDRPVTPGELDYLKKKYPELFPDKDKGGDCDKK